MSAAETCRLIGRWRIFEADLWDRAYLNLGGSGDIAALARCNCFLVIPEEHHALEPGAIVRILLL